MGTFNAESQGYLETVTLDFEITQEIYNNLNPENKEVFFRFNYTGYMYKEISYFIDDVELYRNAIPTSGYENEYNPSLWTWDTELFQKTNCYAYAFNRQTLDSYTLNRPIGNYSYALTPGGYYNRFISEEDAEIPTTGFHTNKLLIIQAIEKDIELYNQLNGTNLIFEEVGRYEVCPPGTYKIAIVLDPFVSGDYHFYRQDSNGYWSHKTGFGPIANVDASNNLILDPYYADRTYYDYSTGSPVIYADYSEFVGYFAVTPFNTFYTGQ
ncbi:MAG: hypothetical protein IKM06_01675 [Clostridia bacterium]|nr:hypothetical protein [Clostridia bacterium]